MAHYVGRLTTLKVMKVKAPGMYADGAGLYLQVSGDGATRIAKSWIYRYTLNGRAHEMGLGPLSAFGLAEARERAAEQRRLKHEGIRERLIKIGAREIEHLARSRQLAPPCTVLVNGDPVFSCITEIGSLADAEITTLEGLGTVAKPHPLQQAFIDEQAAQCGYCSNGMIMSAKALLDRNPRPSEEQVRDRRARAPRHFGAICEEPGNLP